MVEEPQSQNVTVGETVTLRCLLRKSYSSRCHVYWFINGTFWVKGTHVFRGRENDRFRFHGSTKNDLTLTIHDVTDADAGTYKYHCLLVEYDSPNALLRVFVPPSPPSCSTMARNESLSLGQLLNLTCSSFGGKPPAKLTGIRGNNEVLNAEYLQLPHTISIISHILTTT